MKKHILIANRYIKPVCFSFGVDTYAVLCASLTFDGNDIDSVVEEDLGNL